MEKTNRLLCCLLAAVMLCSLLPTPEVWYGQVGGSDLCLTLSTKSGDVTMYCLRSYAEGIPPMD